jgi:undecaprenyl-diphosphatase
MMAFTDFGKLVSLTLLCSGSVAGLVFLRRRREASYLLTSSLGCLVLCTGLKLAFHRSRPEATTQYLLAVPHSFSFPSGHAMGSTGVLLSLLIVARAMKLRKPWLVVATAGSLVLAVGVAASRVYFGVHYASDVVGGELAAGGWVAAVTGWFYPRLLPAEAARSAPG